MIFRKQEAESLHSEMRLTFARDHDRTIIKERFHEGLFHMSKHYREDDYIYLQVINPTAGIFANDSMSSVITLEQGAKAVISSPSSTQVFDMPDEGYAVSDQVIHVGEEACLEFTPQWLVPHKGSSFKQSTSIHLAPTANLYYTELLSPGRKAFGESMLFRKLNLELTLYTDNRLICKEHLQIQNHAEQAMWQIPKWESTYWANVWIASPHLPKNKSELAEISNHFSTSGDELLVGCSRIEENINIIRIASSGTVTIRKALATLRQEFSKHLPLIKNNRINN